MKALWATPLVARSPLLKPVLEQHGAYVDLTDQINDYCRRWQLWIRIFALLRITVGLTTGYAAAHALPEAKTEQDAQPGTCYLAPAQQWQTPPNLI